MPERGEEPEKDERRANEEEEDEERGAAVPAVGVLLGHLRRRVSRPTHADAERGEEEDRERDSGERRPPLPAIPLHGQAPAVTGRIAAAASSWLAW
jgi:hypothetical protein